MAESSELAGAGAGRVPEGVRARPQGIGASRHGPWPDGDLGLVPASPQSQAEQNQPGDARRVCGAGTPELLQPRLLHRAPVAAASSSPSRPGRCPVKDRARGERSHDGVTPKGVELLGPITPSQARITMISGSSKESPSARTTCEDEAEIGVVGDEGLDGFGLKAEQHPERLGDDEEVGGTPPVRKSPRPTKSAGPGPSSPRVEGRGEKGPHLPEDHG